MPHGDDPTRRAALASGVLGLAGGALAAPRIARAQAAPIRWRLVTSWPRGQAGPGVTAQRIVDRINAMAGGRLVVTLFAAGEIVPAFSVLDAVSNGTVEAGHSAALYWQGRIPAAAFFTTVPFGLGPIEHQAWLSLGGGQALWDALYGEWGVKPFLAGNTGPCMGGFFRSPVETPSDIAGLRIRVAGLGASVYARLGATPVTIPAGDTYTALERGTVDAVEFLAPATDHELGLHQVAPLYYAPGFNKPNGASELLVNADALAALPEDLRAIVAEAAEAEHALALADAHRRNATALRAMLSEADVQLVGFPEEVVVAAEEAARAEIDAIAASSDLAGRIVASYRAAREEMAPWSRLEADMARSLARV
ncbi:TRAP transporter substrate-binding protein [Salinarimonas ramus]|uniref:C4-dicarboxylate ABC transporter n=1 Tax=Salinarimonas ramus TaxID=690164 RepID=A0A917Q3D9_9HYPH|nr:TRAP transporter substrate-binding protein [Salinarimonas ramus]GGK19628.1 C4-dicarboxylate ABC transporter [Salinarimonas ramus]